MVELYLVDGVRGLDLDSNLVHVVDFNLGLDGGGQVDGGVNSGSDEALGEGANDTHVGVNLGVEDGHQLDGHLGGDGERNVQRLLGLNESLDGEDDGHDGLPHPQETGGGGLGGVEVEDFEGAGVLERATFGQHLRVALD